MRHKFRPPESYFQQPQGIEQLKPQQKHPAGSVTGVRKWSKLLRPHSEEPVFAFKTFQKKGPSTLGMTTLPWLQPQKGQPQLFSHFLQHVSGGFHQVFPCALPPPLERAHAFPYLRIANISQSNTRHPEPIHLTRREAHSEGSENMKEKNVNVFMSACICQRDVYDV